MINLKQYEVWFVTGSQHLYGPKTLDTVADHSCEIAAALGMSAHVPVQVVFKPVLTTPDAIRQLCLVSENETNSRNHFLSRQFSIRFNDFALGMNPHGFNRIQPGTFFR